MKSCLTLILALSIVATASPALASDHAQGILHNPLDQVLAPLGYQPSINIDITNIPPQDDRSQAHLDTEHSRDHPRQYPLPMSAFSSPPDSILQPIDISPPLPIFPRRTHPVSPVHVRTDDTSTPLPTNKFYGNWLLGDAHAPIWTHPYGLRWDSMGGNWLQTDSPQQGLSISHIDDSSKAFGPLDEHQASRYYLNPFLVSMGMSAMELTQGHSMTVGDFGEFGCTLILTPGGKSEQGRPDEEEAQQITVPVVRGMAFVTGVYRDLTPRVFSNILVRTLTLDEAFTGTSGGGGGWVKYRFLLENGVTWLVYAKANQGGAPLRLELQGQGQAVATSGRFSGVLQIVKVPVGNGGAEATYDQAKGVYATKGDLVIRQKYVNSDTAGYRIDWTLAGDTTAPFIHFTLPHHRSILTTNVTPTTIELASTTKGKMVAYQGASWHLLEPERLAVDFLPEGWPNLVTQEQLQEIRRQAEQDVVNMDFDAGTDLDSMYFAGKGLAKFALLCLVTKDVLQDTTGLYDKCLAKLKSAFQRFMSNQQQNPLVYDVTWKGLISGQGLEKGALADFGNTWYNDHHYHYGYFIHTAAIIRHLDPQWTSLEINSFVHGLLRDVANPSSSDPYFPVFRSFDWFMGHSWSQGIFVSLDGKDEESTSEDINLYYAMSLWGRVAGNPELDKLGQVMLTVARRSIQAYFLMEADNKNQPASFVKNHVTGILFENKVDHTTYFSPRIECIQGIQMIPATPALPMIRRKEFVQQEWDDLLRARVDQIEDGWRSILMMNYATLDKDAAWQYFTSNKNVPLDDGMTKTWALFYVASQKP
ncbi:hypothetical protein MVEG_02500 [Podila verticillata NRRL 6337]|nr:hypothetical protein MVEG_02500 [Podila verticillata NRRL 6337]